MLSKTKIYIDKESLEIIAQDSTISDYYYKNIIEIFRKHALLYINISSEEIAELREPSNLDDPGDLFNFIEGKSLPWPSSAKDNFDFLRLKEGNLDINGNVIYILNNKSDVKRIKDLYGVWAISVEDLDDNSFYYEFKYNPSSETKYAYGSTKNGWINVLGEEVTYFPPSNSVVISDSNLLTNDTKSESGQVHYCGLENLKELLNLVLPKTMGIPYYILVVCPNTGKLEDGKMKKVVRRWIKEIKEIRNYNIIIEFFITRKTVHPRDLYSNYFRIHMERGFYLFEPWSNKVHSEGGSHSEIKISTYLSSPFQRGQSLIESALIHLNEIKEKYKSFLRNTGDPYIIDLIEEPIKSSDYSKNRILF